MLQVTDIDKGPSFFKKEFADLFKITTVFEFVVAFYSFNIYFELVFIPFMTFLILISEFAKLEKDHKIVADLSGWMISTIGFFILVYIGYQLIKHPDSFFNEKTLYDFAVPYLLTIAIFPYLFILMLYSEYERLITKLKITLKDNDLVSYAVNKAIINFNFRLCYYNRWYRYVILHDVKTNIDIDNSINKVCALMKRDRENIPVIFSKGWSHYEARRFLSGHGLKTSYYDHMYYDKWSASSEYLKLGEGFFCNKLKYYIDGDEQSVKCLTLVLEVNEPESFSAAFDKLKIIGTDLFEKSVSSNKALHIETENIDGKKDEIYQTHLVEIEGRHIMIQKRKHVNQETFEIRLSFAVDRESFKYSDTL